LGRRSPRIADNARRELFNDRLRAEYGGREPVFDLAAIESGGVGPRSLRADYTEDGGHLNALGRRDVATALLALFSSIARRS
jgi:lysophospholipase L1-like esterase